MGWAWFNLALAICWPGALATTLVVRWIRAGRP